MSRTRQPDLFNTTPPAPQDDYLNACPPMKQCYYDESLGDTNNVPSCHCGSVALQSNEHWPDCTHLSGKSAGPIAFNTINWLLAGGTWLWGLWMMYMLRKLKMFDFNPVMQALTISMAASAFIFIHQFSELISMVLPSEGMYMAFYDGPIGIAPICLTGKCGRAGTKGSGGWEGGARSRVIATSRSTNLRPFIARLPQEWGAAWSSPTLRSPSSGCPLPAPP